MNSLKQKVFLSPVFLGGLFLLLLNDFYLKVEFHNFLTGKISDFAGLFIFPLFFAAFVPKRRLEIYFLTGFFFIFWKSPFSQSLIDSINNFGILRIGRTIDYTDLVALLILPISFFYFRIKIKQVKTFSASVVRRFASLLIIILSVFAFTATSRVRDRMIMLNSEIKIEKSKPEVESILRNNENLLDLKIRRDDEVFPRNQYPNVEVDLKTFFGDFNIEYEICESKLVKMSFIIIQEKDFTKVMGGHGDFECSLYEDNSRNIEELTNQHKNELNKLFEREVIEKLRQNNSQ